MITDRYVETPRGRLHVYDSGPADGTGTVVLWHHGTPNVGEPPAPLFAAGDELGIRWIAYDRPGYGGSDSQPGWRVADAAGWAAVTADALGVDRFALLSHSGGGPAALATAALLPERVHAVAAIASLAPFGAEGLDWFAGFSDGGRAELTAAVAGREALLAQLAKNEWDETSFTADDHAVLAGEWSWFDAIVEAGTANGTGPFVDDDLAAVAPWGFDPADIAVPALLVAGTADRMVPASHSAWLARRIPGARAHLVPDAGHISVLSSAPTALAWLAGQTAV